MSTLPNPLLELHRQSPLAEFQSYADLEIVSTFGDPEAEYAAVRKSAALMDLPQRGILELSGRDRLSFLNNVLTNQTWNKETKSGLTAGQGVYVFFLNTKGRVVADMNVLERGERTLLEMDARRIAPIKAAFEKFLFSEQVKLADRTGDLHEIALHGPGSLAVLNEAAGLALAPLEAQTASASIRLFDAEAVLWRDDPTGTPGYHLIMESLAAPRVWAALVERFIGTPGKRPLRPIGWAAFNATRIEAGRPMFDIDFGNSADPDASVVPAETGAIARAVSFTKGCYLGQEIVARMHARGQVAKQLAGIRMTEDHLPVAGSPVLDENSNQVGMITSSTVSPVLSNAALCLAMIKRPLFTPGSKVRVPAEGEVREGVVTALPFVAPIT